MRRRSKYGNGRVFQRGGKWWIAVCHHGKEHREPGGATKDEALDRLRARRDEMKREVFTPPSEERLTVDELLDEFLLTLRNRGVRRVAKVESHLRAVRAFFGKLRTKDVTTPLVDRYTSMRRAAGRAAATVARELESLRQAYREAARYTPPRIRFVPYIPVPKVQNARQGFIGRGDFEAILGAVKDPDLRDFIAFAWWTAMRHGEIAQLTWENFNREGNWTLRLHASAAKVGVGRTLVVEGPLRAIIERRLQRRRLDVPLVFYRTAKGKVGAPVKDFRAAWAAACRSVGLVPGRSGLTFHDLRRSGIRNMVRAGVSETVAMKISGHRTRSMFDRYNITSEADLLDAVQRTESYVSALPTERTVATLNSDKTRTVAVANGGKSFIVNGDLAEAGRNRTYRPWC